MHLHVVLPGPAQDADHPAAWRIARVLPFAQFDDGLIAFACLASILGGDQKGPRNLIVVRYQHEPSLLLVNGPNEGGPTPLQDIEHPAFGGAPRVPR
jgi:hypothetical protein